VGSELRATSLLDLFCFTLREKAMSWVLGGVSLRSFERVATDEQSTRRFLFMPRKIFTSTELEGVREFVWATFLYLDDFVVEIISAGEQIA